MRLKIITFLAGLTGLAILTGVYALHCNFLRFREDIKGYVAGIPKDEMAIPTTVLKVLKNTKTKQLNASFSKDLCLYLRDKKKIKEDHLYFVGRVTIWRLVLPIYLNENEFYAARAHMTYFGKEQYGLKNAAQFYFAKDWSDLNENEVITLLTISWSPTLRPGEEPFNKKFQEFLAEYQGSTK